MNGLINGLDGWQESVEVQRLSTVLLHFVWQGAVIALVAWCALKLLARATAATRYGVLLGLFGLLSAAPVATYWVADFKSGESLSATQDGLENDSTGPVLKIGVADGVSMMSPFPTHPEMRKESITLRADAQVGIAPLVSDPDSTSGVNRQSPMERASEWVQKNRASLIALWLAGVLLQSLRLLIGLIGAEAATRRGTTPAGPAVEAVVSKLIAALELRRVVRVLESRFVDSPMVAGWLKPVILLPATAATGLTASQLEAILAHELAHIRRHDALVNLFQTLVETLLFYHPAVWWLSRRIRDEREHCCDDVAVSVCGDRVALARALCAMAELRPTPRWALAARGGSLIERVRRLIGRPEELSTSRWPAAAVVMAAVFAVWVGMQSRPGVAEDKSVKSDTTATDSQTESAATAKTEEKKPAVGHRLTLPPGPIAMDAVVARVNGEPVAARLALLELKGELDEGTKTLSPEELRGRQEKLLRERMSALVDLELFVQAIKTRMTKAQWEKVSAQFDQQVSLAGAGSDFDQDVATEAEYLGISTEEARRMMVRSLLAQQYLDAKIGAIDVTSDELKTAYRDRSDEFQNPPRARWRQLQFKFGEERDATRRKAEMAAALGNGGMSFESITKKLTGVVYSEQEGDPNWSPVGGRLAAELQRPLSELKPGGVSDAIEGADCCWVIQLVERTEAALPPYEKVENRIRLKLTEEKRAAKERAISEELRAKFPVVTVFDESPVDESRIVRQPDEVATATAIVPVVPAGDQTSQQSGIPKGTEKIVAKIQVLSADGKPAAGAKVRPTSYGTIAGSSFGLTEDWFPSAVTDDTGRATLKCLNAEILAEFSGETGVGRLMRMLEFPVGNDGASEILYLEIDHPSAPVRHEQISAQSKEATITLAKASTIRVKAIRAEDGQPVSRLAPSFGGPWGTKPDWSEAGGVLTIRRLDLKSQQAPRWLTLVHVPETGPAMFSDPIDLKRFADEEEIALTVAMRDGTRVEGELDRRIPRPIQNGRVVGQVVFGIPEKGTWAWAVAADVNEDGKFVLESVPPDLTLQVMAYCDGWISRSADVEELREFKARSGFWASEAGMDHNFSVHPQLHHVSSRTMRLTMSMEPTADCEVTVIDDNGQPVVGASVAFQPNVHWFNGGSSLISPGADALDWWRKRLAEGHDPALEPPPMTRFSAFTDAQGMASIRNLPSGVNQMFMVASPGLTVRDELPEYASIGLPGGFQKTILTAGEVTRVKVPMTKDLGPLILASPEEPPVQ